jgi:hypothetical protein
MRADARRDACDAQGRASVAGGRTPDAIAREARIKQAA